MKMINFNDLVKDEYTMQDVAKIMETTPRTITNYCLKGEITYEKTKGGQKRISKDSLIAYLKTKNLLADSIQMEDNTYDIIYARVDKSELHLDKQLDKICRKVFFLNPRNGKILQDIVSDDDGRPEFKSLITLIVKDKIRRVFVWHTNIFDSSELTLLKDLCKEHNTLLVNCYTIERNK